MNKVVVSKMVLHTACGLLDAIENIAMIRQGIDMPKLHTACRCRYALGAKCLDS
jgi:hypothetical protein